MLKCRGVMVLIVLLFILLVIVKHKTVLENYSNPNSRNILITQFFIHDNPKRYQEFKYCVQQNVKNKYIDEIVMLNERIYTSKEMGVKSDKIKQIDFKKRLTFKDAFQYMKNRNENNYYMLCNLDIFFDDTLLNIPKIKLDQKKYMLALVRNEFKRGMKLSDCKTTGVNWAQDTWIIHNNNLKYLKHLSIIDFNMGVGRCDNRLAFLLKEWGLRPISIPNVIRTYHNHDEEEQKKGWKRQKQIPGRGLFLDPDYSSVEDFKIPS